MERAAFIDIKNYLSNNHIGEKRAIKSRKLQELFNAKGSEIRESINILRGIGEPICSSYHGYFYAETDAEIRATIEHLEKRIESISRAKQGLEKTLGEEKACG